MRRHLWIHLYTFQSHFRIFKSIFLLIVYLFLISFLFFYHWLYVSLIKSHYLHTCNCLIQPKHLTLLWRIKKDKTIIIFLYFKIILIPFIPEQKFLQLSIVLNRERLLIFFSRNRHFKLILNRHFLLQIWWHFLGQIIKGDGEEVKFLREL